MPRNCRRRPRYCPLRSNGISSAAYSPVSCVWFRLGPTRAVFKESRVPLYGSYRTNKFALGHCKNLARIPSLWCVSSIDSLKKAQLLNKHRGELIASSSTTATLNVHVQVNTSGEESKSGCPPGPETVSLCRSIESDCPNLNLLGLMTIGAIARSVATTPETENEDFSLLKEQRDLVARELGIERELELSMGMSEDFEGAIAAGSHEVRIGSTIFGLRPAKGDAKLVV